MKLYICATGNISPQHTFRQQSIDKAVGYSGNRLKCIEPDYTSIIDPKLIRRMSRIIKMGVAAANECLREAEITNPDAIITGTAYGCLDDTGIFLRKMIDQSEEMLTPTAFIQSTHNTVGAQIALMLHCHNYNNTFVHSAFSFESALMDASMLLAENPSFKILAGSVDEITDISHAVLNRFGLYRRELKSSLTLTAEPSKGTIAGEGAAFFMLGAQPKKGDYAELTEMDTRYGKMSPAQTEEKITAFLNRSGLHISDIDLVITGRNGNHSDDQIYDSLEEGLFAGRECISYKQLCGEYPSSTSFALWLAATEIRKSPKKILVYNHYQHKYHSLFLLGPC